MKILHVITDLGQGGAEVTLVNLVRETLTAGPVVVVSLRKEALLATPLREMGVPVHCLDMPRGLVTIVGLIKLYKILRQFQPDVVQTWMYHSDLLGGILARLAGTRNVYWGVHHSSLNRKGTSARTLGVIRLCAMLSDRIPKRIINCSSVSAELHALVGYSPNRIRVIPNGYDLEKYRPDIQAGGQLRQELGLPADATPILGMVARYHPQKDHPNLIQALKILKEEGYAFKCALIGPGMCESNLELLGLIRRARIVNHVLLLGERQDMNRVYNALDMHVLSSLSEAFPNVLAESMACGTPCITTDVGDARMIVGDTGWSVPARDCTLLAISIAQAIAEYQNEPIRFSARRLRSRERIVRNFSVQQMAKSYLAQWTESLPVE